MMNFIKEVFSVKNLKEVILLAGLRNPNLNYGAFIKANDSIKELEEKTVTKVEANIHMLKEVA